MSGVGPKCTAEPKKGEDFVFSQHIFNVLKRTYMFYPAILLFTSIYQEMH